MNNRQEFVNKWIGWLDADIRQGVFAEWQKDNKRELKEFLEELKFSNFSAKTKKAFTLIEMMIVRLS